MGFCKKDSHAYVHIPKRVPIVCDLSTPSVSIAERANCSTVILAKIYAIRTDRISSRTKEQKKKFYIEILSNYFFKKIRPTNDNKHSISPIGLVIRKGKTINKTIALLKKTKPSVFLGITMKKAVGK